MYKKIIITGGGTGGHIFPAIAIANAIKKLAPDVEILFVGAVGKMEMEKVPEAGYKIIGLDIQGYQRRFTLKNLTLPFKIFKSMRDARRILDDFRPDAVVGVGGYASGPMLMAAKMRGIPYLIQEQNSYAGLTNKRLGKGAEKISVAYEGMDAFFPREKLFLSGNPIRKESIEIEGKSALGLQEFGLTPDKKVILIIGGSLGARTLNESVIASLDKIVTADVQVIWQCGKLKFDHYSEQLAPRYLRYVALRPFVEKMDLAYAAADLIISRAGAGTIAELCTLSKPMILVPSPNVAEDHQTRNAEALVKKNAAVLIKDSEAEKELFDAAFKLLENEKQCAQLAKNSREMAVLDADEVIAKEVLMLANKR